MSGTEVISKINQLRSDPTSLAKNLNQVKKFLERSKRASTVKELGEYIDNLPNQKILKPLETSQGLNQAAMERVNQIINSGDVHSSFTPKELSDLVNRSVQAEGLFAIVDHGDSAYFLSRALISDHDPDRTYKEALLNSRNRFVGAATAEFNDEDLTVVLLATNVEETSPGDRITYRFKIHYISLIEEELFIVGNQPELGDWRNLVCRMDWTNGHYWTKELSFSKSLEHVEFKFVCYNNVSHKTRWELGAKRFLNLQFDENNQDQEYVWDYYQTKFLMRLPIQQEESVRMLLDSINWSADMTRVSDDQQENNDLWGATVNIPMSRDVTYKYAILAENGNVISAENRLRSLRMDEGNFINYVNDDDYQAEAVITEEVNNVDEAVEEEPRLEENQPQEEEIPKEQDQPEEEEDDEEHANFDNRYGDIL